MEDYLLRMEHICKSFPGVQALDRARIEVKEGEIHALMGENGAGKSTFMKILNGLLQPDSGDIYFEGRKIKVQNPAQALQMGIAMIYQELNPVGEMSVAENIFLGKEFTYGKSFFVNKKKGNREARKLLKDFGLEMEPEVMMKTLSLAQMQMIEIMKAVSSGAKLIVMDEPTSSLTDDEIKILFQKMDELSKNGVSIIYISHRMEEIFKVSHMVTVMRDGTYIGALPTGELDSEKLIHMMVGRELHSVFAKSFAKIKQEVLQVRRLSGQGFSEISFDVRAGEILGFYGLMGAGRSEVFRSIFGLDTYASGEILMEGKRYQGGHPIHAIQAGIAMVTEDRKNTGLVLCRSIKENIALPNLDKFKKGIFLDKGKEVRECEDIAGKITVKMSDLSQLAGNLSGGNQQKVVLCKWMMKHPKLLILDEPTRGIDVGAKAEIHALICEFAKAGMGIVLVSSELLEVMGMSDRIVIMHEGRIRGTCQNGEYSQDEILRCALGGDKDNE